MLAIAILVGAFAYGRIAKSFDLRVWAILAAVATAGALLSVMVEKVPFGVLVLIAATLQFLIMVLLFALGSVFGKWLDRNKNLD